MTPRKTKQGASANARRTAPSRSPRAAASTRSVTKNSGRSAAAKRRTAPAASARRKTASRGPAAVATRWWMLPVAVAAVLFAFAWAYYPVMAVQYREARQRAQLAAELKSIRERNERLRKQVDRLKTPAGVEDYARSELGMVKKGEHVVVVVDGDEAAEASRAVAAPVIDSDETKASPAGPWTAFLDLVFGVQ